MVKRMNGIPPLDSPDTGPRGEAISPKLRQDETASRGPASARRPLAGPGDVLLLPAEAGQAILDYLIQRPFREVFEFVQVLTKLPVVPREKLAEKVPGSPSA